MVPENTTGTVLGNDGDGFAQLVKPQRGDVQPIDQNLAIVHLVDFIHSQQHQHHRALARSCAASNTYFLSRVNHARHLLQHVLEPGSIFHRDVLKLNFSMGWPTSRDGHVGGPLGLARDVVDGQAKLLFGM